MGWFRLEKTAASGVYRRLRDICPDVDLVLRFTDAALSIQCASDGLSWERAG